MEVFLVLCNVTCSDAKKENILCNVQWKCFKFYVMLLALVQKKESFFLFPWCPGQLVGTWTIPRDKKKSVFVACSFCWFPSW